MDKAKDDIPKKCRIGDTCFMTLATIRDNLCPKHLKNIIHLQKDVNDFLSLIIDLESNVYGVETVFFYGVNMSDIEKISHVLKYSPGRCGVVAFDKILH